MNCRGLTLVELLLAAALGSALCLACTILLAHSRQAFLRDEQVARTQENGHYALRLLTRELSMAGYLGESLPDEVVRLPAGGTDCYRHMVQQRAALEHYDNLSAAGTSSSGGGIPTGCERAGDHQSGADGLLVRRTMDLPAILRGERLHPTAADILYLRSGQNSAEIVRGADGLAADDSLWRYHPQLFFLRSYSRYRGDGIPALCRIRLSPEAERTAPVECLAEGVEQLQLEFGIDSDGDRIADRYLVQPTAAELGRAVIARVQLLMRSPLPLPGHRDDNSYALLGGEVAEPGDRYYRRLMSTAVVLRNADANRY